MIKKNDFIEIEYTGKTKDEGIVFDTTDKDLAKEQGYLQENATFGPAIVCVGAGQVIGGLDDKIVGKEIGKDYSIELEPEEAFGKKDAKLVQLVPTGKFKEHKVNPVPGLQINMDGMTGIIKTVSGGRTLVDFNHPLSGKNIVYDIKVLRLVEDDSEKLSGFLKVMGLPATSSVTEGKATIELPMELQPDMQEHITGKIKESISTITDVTYKKKESTTKEK